MTYQDFVVKQMETAKTPTGKRAEEKEKVVANTGAVEMHYSEYKNKYSNCKTVPGSYDKKTKTIMAIVENKNGICTKCGTYCCGDCQA